MHVAGNLKYARRYSLNLVGKGSTVRDCVVCMHTETPFFEAINPENGGVYLSRVDVFVFTASVQLANYVGECE